jgi:tetratricopeptide (TPR) repeat protein
MRIGIKKNNIESRVGKKRGILFVVSLFLFAGGWLSAQTLEQARTMFARKQYDTAKPVFEKYLKGAPANPNYNYWYGVCCLKTGEAEKAIKPLEMALAKKIQQAPFFLGEAYREVWRFDEAVKCYHTYIDLLKQKKELTDEVELLLEESKLYARMLKGVEDVCVVDSFVVDKENFLEVYKIGEEAGKLHKYNSFFPEGGNSEAIVYETELENIIYYSRLGEDNTLSIYTQIRMQDGWGTAVPFPEMINDSANVNYPFMLADGVTIYYASDGKGSLGGYDIFVTRYNSAAESYLVPENIGMPFNSSFNDYMYAIDEYKNLGWFASDRYQPDDKVCVYVFVPNKFKKTYNYEVMAHKDIVALAQLRSLQQTWKDESIVAEAKSNLDKAFAKAPEENKTFEFEFVIDDQKTYHSLNDFKSPRARETFARYRQLEIDYRQQRDKLATLRDQYAYAGKTEQTALAPRILDLEKRVNRMQEEWGELAIAVRYEEKKNVKK